MFNKHYINFIIILLLKYRARHLWVFVIASLLVALLSAFFFITSSLEQQNKNILETHPDFVVQKYRAGRVHDVPLSWVKEYSTIAGVKEVSARVYGIHFYDPSENYFTIVGIDFEDKKVLENFKKIFPNISIQEFLSKEHMIIGTGAKKLFEYYEYKEYYTFRPPNKSKQRVYFHSEIPQNSAVYTNDMVLMDVKLARKILGLADDYCSDVALTLKENADKEEVRVALMLSHFDIRILFKDFLQKDFTNILNYKGGVFLALYLFSFITFLLLLFQRYTHVTHNEVKEIAIFRMSGWTISDIIYLKLLENFIVASFAFMLGFSIAYIYVFYFHAPLLREIFLGFHNLQNHATFVQNISPSIVFESFFLFVIPFMLVILIPVYKTATIEPHEALR